MDPAQSPLETLRQLREMFDAGTLTAAEFEALKQQLVYGPAAAAAAPPALPAAPVPTAIFDFAAPPAAATETPPPAAADSFIADTYETAAAPPPTNYLNLVLSIGGLLLLFGLVLYLAANRHPSERIGSTSLTAADTTAVVEVGPQAAPLPAVPVAAPETIRLAPASPAPPVVRPSRAAADSAARQAPGTDSTAVR